MNKCDRVPEGYYCDLEAGHEGPCPAWPKCPECGDWKEILARYYTDDGQRYCRRCNRLFKVF